MPQASDDLRKRMEDRFGSIDIAGPLGFLEERGWVLTEEYQWREPLGTVWPLDDDVADCLDFLFEEWDFGGIDASN